MGLRVQMENYFVEFCLSGGKFLNFVYGLAL